MAVTPNYSWPVPDDTDLVKDGAEAIRDLGNAIDTTVDSLPSGGLVHIKTETITGTPTAVSVNDVFSSTFQNYKMFASYTGSTVASVNLRYRVAGADNSTTNYRMQESVFDNAYVGARTVEQTANRICNINTTLSTIDCTFFNPFETTPSIFIGLGFGSLALPVNFFNASRLNTNDSFTGFSLIATAGTFTAGKIRVYGIKD